jgi:hypothetical protein
MDPMTFGPGPFTVLFLLCIDPYLGATTRLHSADVVARSTFLFGVWARFVDYHRY